jgi:hypothetical protein
VQHSRFRHLRGSCMPNMVRNPTKSWVAENSRCTSDRRKSDNMYMWSTPRIGSQVSSLGTLKGAAQRIFNESPVPLELMATSISRSTSNRFITSCTIGIRCALSACYVFEFHFSNILACTTSWIRTLGGSLSRNATGETSSVMKLLQCSGNVL